MGEQNIPTAKDYMRMLGREKEEIARLREEKKDAQEVGRAYRDEARNLVKKARADGWRAACEACAKHCAVIRKTLNGLATPTEVVLTEDCENGCRALAARGPEGEESE